MTPSDWLGLYWLGFVLGSILGGLFFRWIRSEEDTLQSALVIFVCGLLWFFVLPGLIIMGAIQAVVWLRRWRQEQG